jgi:hypothetical protein
MPAFVRAFFICGMNLCTLFDLEPERYGRPKKKPKTGSRRLSA